MLGMVGIRRFYFYIGFTGYFQEDFDVSPTTITQNFGKDHNCINNKKLPLQIKIMPVKTLGKGNNIRKCTTTLR